MTRAMTHVPPAFLQDLANTRNGLQEWDEFVSLCFEVAISELSLLEAGTEDPPPVQPQFFDATAAGEGGTGLIEQPIFWNAFPKSLALSRGRDWAMKEADTLWKLPSEQVQVLMPAGLDLLAQQFLFRPQDEYCEWRVERDAATGKIGRIVFTCESPEYWTALYGGVVRIGRLGRPFTFTGDRGYATDLYRQLTGGNVQVGDLALPDGSYNRFNRWNSSHGIVHLAHIANSIAAEVSLAADGTLLRRRADGSLVTNADELIGCSGGIGLPSRNSDPTICGVSNALARLGARITLAEPVGIYMCGVDVNGWSLPDGIRPSDCWRMVRGDEERGMLERIVVEVPPETGLTVSDITVGGEPVWFGGQIAECIQLKLLGCGDVGAHVENVPRGPESLPCLARLGGVVLSAEQLGPSCPPGLRPAFGHSVVAGPITAGGGRRPASRKGATRRWK